MTNSCKYASVLDVPRDTKPRLNRILNELSSKYIKNSADVVERMEPIIHVGKRYHGVTPITNLRNKNFSALPYLNSRHLTMFMQGLIHKTI
jgi:hypothetical protein